jgi:hypothetical protein
VNLKGHGRQCQQEGSVNRKAVSTGRQCQEEGSVNRKAVSTGRITGMRLLGYLNRKKL